MICDSQKAIKKNLTKRKMNHTKLLLFNLFINKWTLFFWSSLSLQKKGAASTIFACSSPPTGPPQLIPVLLTSCIAVLHLLQLMKPS